MKSETDDVVKETSKSDVVLSKTEDKEEITSEETLQEKVRNKLKEDREYAKSLTSKMRKSQQKELKPRETFINAIDNARKELEEGLNFLRRVEMEPKLLFEESNVYFNSTRGMIYTIMNHWKNPNDSIKGHDFQVYLAHIANDYFQRWLKENGRKDEFKIEVRNQNQFPSIFVVYHENTELIQFNMLKKWYGVRSRPLTEEKIMEKHEKELNRINKEIEEQKQRLAKAITRRDRPLEHYKGIKNFIYWLVLDKKKMYESFNKYVKREQSFLNQLEEEKERTIQSLPFLLEESKEKHMFLEQIEPFFQAFTYELNTSKSSLY